MKNNKNNNCNFPTLRFPEFTEQWKEDSIGDVISIKSDKHNPESCRTEFICIELESISQGTGKLLDTFNSAEQKSIKNKFSSGSVLFGKLRPYLKKFYLPDFEGVCSSEIWVMTSKKIEPVFLYSLIQTPYFIGLANQSSGSKMPRADWGLIANSKIAYSPNSRERVKIGRFLKLIDERITTQNKIIAHLESLIKGLSQIVFENNAGWEASTISEVASVVSGGTPNTSIPSFWGGDINWFTPSEIGRVKYVNCSDQTITEKGLRNSSAKLLPPNSLLLSTRATIGECSICQSICATNQGFQSLVATHVDYEFLYYFMRTKKSELIKKSSGSTFSEISANEVKQLKIFVPTINTQKQIANLLKSVDEKITIETKILSAYTLQKQTLLQRLFI